MLEFDPKSKTFKETKTVMTHDQTNIDESSMINQEYNYKNYKSEDFIKGIKDKTTNLANILILKNKKYGNSFFRSCDKYGEVSYLIRLEDKFSRLTNLIIKDIDDGQTNDTINETVDDTLLDIAGYALLALEYRSQNKERFNNESKL